MTALLESMGPESANALIWTVSALVGLLVLLVIIRIIRSLTFGTFVAGGKNRKARLAVMDATAVDSQRRLVLVRRDDIEHLLLIGGPSDVVVEQNIRLLPPLRRPMAEEPAASPQIERAATPIAQPKQPPATRLQQQSAQPQPQPSAQRHAPQPAPHYTQELRTSPAAATAPAPVTQSQAYRSATPPAASQPAPVHAKAPPSAPREAPTANVSNELLQELKLTLETDRQKSNAQASIMSIDDEMSRLLGELSPRKN